MGEWDFTYKTISENFGENVNKKLFRFAGV